MADFFSPSSENPLASSSQFVKGVGPQRYEKLLKLGLVTVGDLLFYLPRAYEALTNRLKIADLKANDEPQTIVGEVVEIEGKTTHSGKDLVSIVFSDGGDKVLEATFFNQPFVANKLRYGMLVACTGKPRHYRGHWQMNNPRLRPVDQGTLVDENSEVLPLYSLTEGLHAEAMRRIQREVVERYASAVREIVPLPLITRHAFPRIGEALRAVHIPQTMGDAERGRQRLAYDELLVLQVALGLQRRDQQVQSKATPLARSRLVDERIRKLFPFDLTQGQEKVIHQICEDMSKERPMRRLLQADVGAGKTAVALYAMLVAVANKHQAALMAPTEVLARQHWRTLNRYLANSKVKMEFLVGGISSNDRRIALGEIKRGQVDLVVGTQALIQNDIEFANLGLVVIDEQHRFGVQQRATIRHKGLDPHYLVMTATPIPRTIALTVFGDLDVAVIRELPPGRKPVKTMWTPEEERAELMAHLCQQMKAGRQLYVVCPMVEESADNDLKGVIDTAKLLSDGPFHDFKVGILHGRMDDRAKDFIMQQFQNKELDCLVSTTVIEVGVDVSNATLMVIEHAERFGLSQLHQLRGRVSRGPVAGECYLFANTATPESKDRLRFFCKNSDGFKLAEKDLELRGMGEFFGTRQHGVGELKIAHPIRDAELLDKAQHDALELIQRDPGLQLPENAGIRAAVLSRYGTVLGLAGIG
ncbi:MAG: ATP-dependent DNA helicase RecG [Gemmatales bacterium]